MIHRGIITWVAILLLGAAVACGAATPSPDPILPSTVSGPTAQPTAPPQAQPTTAPTVPEPTLSPTPTVSEIVPDTPVFEAGPCLMTRAAQLPVEFEYKGTIPTRFDGINRANCTFTKEVKTVTVTLTGPAKHTETFTLSEAATQVSFPLPEEILSISTLEIVPPGEYQREMTVTSVDGATLVISNQPGVLKTVTVLEP